MRTLLPALCLLTACTANVEITEDTDSTAGTSITLTDYLSGCHGKASAAIPSDDLYVMTTFGGPGDHQRMSCGGYADGTGWYAASRQRYGCGAHLRVEANGKCVVLEAQDYGPDVCVEAAAHKPILDMSPRASKALYGVAGAGWSDHLVVTVTEVAKGTPLGPCTASGDGGGSGSGSDTGGGSGSGSGSDTGGTTTAATCSSATLDRDVDDGTCVQSASDGAWYQCSSGQWLARASSAGCADAYGFCDSPTLGYAVEPRACVQSQSTGTWYQCNGQAWTKPVDVAGQSGPIGTCSSMHAL